MQFWIRLSRLQEHFVHVAPAPVLAGLERLHHRMLGLMKMPGRVLVLGRIAAADMAALETKPQVHPSIVHFQALLAALAAWFHFVDVEEVEFGEAALPGRGILPRVAPREKTAGQRTPDYDPDARILAERNHLVLEIAAYQRVVHLRRDEGRISTRVLYPQKLRCL